jgi:hypothetical protein
MSQQYTVDECPEQYRVLYWHYLNDPATNSEQTMSHAEFVAFRKRLERDANLDSI